MAKSIWLDDFHSILVDRVYGLEGKKGFHSDCVKTTIRSAFIHKFGQLEFDNFKRDFLKRKIDIPTRKA